MIDGHRLKCEMVPEPIQPVNSPVSLDSKANLVY